MQWTVAYYEFQRRKWDAALVEHSDISPGAAAYCCRKAEMWKDLAGFAERLFKASDADNLT